MRAPVPADAQAVLAVLDARDIADLGVSDFTLADLEEEWAASDFELARDAVVIESEAGRIAGYGAVRMRGALAAVDPAQEGQGIGARLLAWIESRQRERGERLHRQWVAATNHRALRLLREHGYEPLRSYYRMERRLDRPPAPGPPPPGIRARELDPTRDPEPLYRLDDAAFSTVADYEPESLAKFREEHFESHDIDSVLSTVAENEHGPVAFAIVRRWPGAVGYIDILAVHPDHQARGIGRFLLENAFARMAAAGLGSAQLGVAADNPRALRVYERAGMTPRFVVETLARPVSTGRTGAATGRMGALPVPGGRPTR